jgi:S-formylglutathione hydrolase FrmB
MAFLDVHAFSDVLKIQVSFHVLLPQQTTQEIGVELGKERASHPVLWLLHGLSDDHTIWLRRTSIERYAAARNLAVVMPAAGRSFYQDMASGPRYWTFLTEELPALCRGWFRISAERETISSPVYRWAATAPCAWHWCIRGVTQRLQA